MPPSRGPITRKTSSSEHRLQDLILDGDPIRASLPVGELRSLADLRGRAEIRVVLSGERAWVRWDANSEIVLELSHGGSWRWKGWSSLASVAAAGIDLVSTYPPSMFRFEIGPMEIALEQFVIPGRLSVLRPGSGVAPSSAFASCADEGERKRDAAAMRCSLAAVSDWAEIATSAQRLAPCKGPGGSSETPDSDAEVVVVGSSSILPLLPESVRYWGNGLLIPLGFRPARRSRISDSQHRWSR